MGRLRRRARRRKRIGRVSYYFHHGAWYVYYRDESNRQVRRPVGDREEIAVQAASQLNAQLSAAAPTMFSFTPITVAELRRRFLDHHEQVLRSSLATIRRYRSASKHLEDFVDSNGGAAPAHFISADQFIRYLRNLRVPPNGHPHAIRRPLRDKGIRFVLEVCRSLFGFAAKRRHLPPYAENPFADLRTRRMKVEDAKPIFVFDQPTALAFFQAACAWSFPVFCSLAMTGLRPGELLHLLIEDLDLVGGWLHVRNKPELGWLIKTRRQRAVPLAAELVEVLRSAIGVRAAGPLFVRPKFQPLAAPLANTNSRGLAKAFARRLADQAASAAEALTREQEARIARGVWRDAGAVKPGHIRNVFIRIMRAIGHEHVTCPKSWRHTFATLLQDANVDPLVRQLTLGHHPADSTTGSLGMTALYTHTRPETQHREILRALSLWPAVLQFAHQWAQGGNPCSAN